MMKYIVKGDGITEVIQAADEKKAVARFKRNNQLNGLVVAEIKELRK